MNKIFKDSFSFCIQRIKCLCAKLLNFLPRNKKELCDDNDENDDYKEIRKPLDTYLARNKPSFAFFINGAWGSGKTYFINHYKTRAKCKYPCYVSLFGVTDKKDFEHRLWKGLLFAPHI